MQAHSRGHLGMQLSISLFVYHYMHRIFESRTIIKSGILKWHRETRVKIIPLSLRTCPQTNETFSKAQQKTYYESAIQLEKYQIPGLSAPKLSLVIGVESDRSRAVPLLASSVSCKLQPPLRTICSAHPLTSEFEEPAHIPSHKMSNQLDIHCLPDWTSPCLCLELVTTPRPLELDH